MRRTSVFAVAFLIAGTVLVKGQVEKPSKLPLNKLAPYFNLRRAADRALQQGQYGRAIGQGKMILDEYVTKDPYAAYCVAAGYAALDPETTEGVEPVEEAIEYLNKAVEWGFRNVSILENSEEFDHCRGEEGFQKIVESLKEKVQQENKQERLGYTKKVMNSILRKKKKADFKLDTTDMEGNKVTDSKFKGKSLIVVVLRPNHSGVISEIPTLKEVAKEAKDKGVTLLGAVYNYEYTDLIKKRAAEFVSREKLPFPCVMVERPWAKRYKILNLPSHLIVSGGKVLYKTDGVLPQWKLEKLIGILSQ